MRCFTRFFLLLVVVRAPLWACPLCKEALTGGMAKGFYWSILLMLAVPMVVVATIVGALWRAGKKRRDPLDAHHE